jgi:hypothetical protein
VVLLHLWRVNVRRLADLFAFYWGIFTQIKSHHNDIGRGEGAGDRAGALSARAGAPLARAGQRGARAGVSADDGKAQQHFEQSLGKRTEKKEEEIVLVVCLVISSHV